MKKNKIWILTIVVFGLIFFTRFAFLGADLASQTVEIEEKSGGYSARNLVTLGHWAIYQNWYQPMVHMPIQNLISYLSFSLFGVGLIQLRLPIVIAGFFSLIVIFLVLLKQTNPSIALMGVSVYAFNFIISIWNRSALTENLSLLLIPLSVYFLTKENFRPREVFLFIFFAALNLAVKIDGYPFLAAALFFLFLYSIKSRSILKNIKPTILGIMAAVVFSGILLGNFGGFKYLSSAYKFNFSVFVGRASIRGIPSSFEKMMTIILGIEPYLPLLFLIILPAFWVYRKFLNKTDFFLILFFLIFFVTRLAVPADAFSWKRVMFFFFPIIYFITRGLFLILNEDLNSGKKLPPKKIPNFLFLSFYWLLTIFFFFFFFKKPILWFSNTMQLTEIYHYSKSAFCYLSIIVLLMTIIFGRMVIFGQTRKLTGVIGALMMLFIWISLSTNLLGVIKIFLPQNIRYSYDNNKKFSSLIDENGLIIANEQAVRALIYLSKYDFYFKHDGSYNPIIYREALEREDIRYFIINAEDFWDQRWGVSNRVRMALIQKNYPDLKLKDIFFATNTWLAIYDKYGAGKE